MTDLPNDPLDDAFAQQLRRLKPARASAEESSRGTLSVESLLYHAGYQAALAESDDVDQRQMRPGEKSLDSRRLANWMPMIAASAMTAALTLPIAYRMGGSPAETADDKIAERDDSISSLPDQPGTPDEEEPDGQSPDGTAPRDPPLVPKSKIRPIPILNLASLLKPVWTLPEPSTETMSAFNAPALDSIPRSGWIAMEDESIVPQETMSAGDLGKFTIGLQVNPR